MLPGHEVTIERRGAKCCDRHSVSVAVCSCGWEQEAQYVGAETGPAIMGHRLTVIESAIVALSEGQQP